MGGARLPLTVELGSTHLTLREVELIRPGDVIPLDRRASEDLEIRIGDETHLRGQPGRVGHRCAVCITGYAEED
jgi:flagellar motor switch protein FliM